MLVDSGGDLNILGYTDSDFQADRDSRNSISGLLFTIGRMVVDQTANHQLVPEGSG